MRSNFPWLYYRNPSIDVLNAKNIVNFEVSIDPIDPLNFYSLSFVLYVYSFNGIFLREEPLTDKFSFCTKSINDGHVWRKFQTSYLNECEMDVNDFIKKQNNTLEFYELFMIDMSNPTQIIDVPVLIINIENPLFPGKLNNETGLENSILTRRFFLIDNISGIQGDGNFVKGSLPTVIRYPVKIKLVITLRNDISQAKIYPPYLEIFYKSKLVSTISQSYLSAISFSVDYTMDITKFMKTMLGFLIALTIIVVIGSSLSFNVWLNTHPKLYDPVIIFI